MDLFLDFMNAFPRTTPCSYSAWMGFLFVSVAASGMAIGYGIAKCEKPGKKYAKS